MQQPLFIFTNWKMNPSSPKEALALLKSYTKLTLPKGVSLISLVPYPYLPLARKTLGGRALLGTQTISPDKEGAHTGEVSIGMLVNEKPRYSIVGHSERRAGGETDEKINQQILTLLKAKMVPILCVGEQHRDEHGFFLQVVENQIKIALQGVSQTMLSGMVIAYEPVWAIGKDATREATPAECHEMTIFIRKVITDMYGRKPKQMPVIIYGGSVSEINARAFAETGGVEGFLLGRVSLDPKKLQKLITSLSYL